MPTLAATSAIPTPTSPMRNQAAQRAHLSGSWDHLGESSRLKNFRHNQLGGSCDQLASYPPLPAPPNCEAIRSPDLVPMQPSDAVYNQYQEDVSSPVYTDNHTSFSYSDLQSPGIANLHRMYSVQSPGYNVGSPAHHVGSYPGEQSNYFTYDEAAQSLYQGQGNSIYGTTGHPTMNPPLKSPGLVMPTSPGYNYPLSPDGYPQSPQFSFLQSPHEPQPTTDSSPVFTYPEPPNEGNRSVDNLLMHTLGRGPKKKKSFWNSSIFSSGNNKVAVSDDLISPRDSMSGAKGLLNEPGQNNCFLNSAVQVRIFGYFLVYFLDNWNFNRNLN